MTGQRVVAAPVEARDGVEVLGADDVARPGIAAEQPTSASGPRAGARRRRDHPWPQSASAENVGRISGASPDQARRVKSAG